jgi:hypothetical protein
MRTQHAVLYTTLGFIVIVCKGKIIKSVICMLHTVPLYHADFKVEENCETSMPLTLKEAGNAAFCFT